MKFLLFFLCSVFINTAVGKDAIPPSDYEGIELLESRFKDVLDKFGEAELFDVPLSHHEEGYCYTSPDGVSVTFSGLNELTQIQISRKPPSSFCEKIEKHLDHCIGLYCLGDSQSQIESKIGRKLISTTTGSGSKVAYFEYSRLLTEKEIKKWKGKIEKADVQHNLWVIFGESGAETLGVVKFESY